MLYFRRFATVAFLLFLCVITETDLFAQVVTAGPGSYNSGIDSTGKKTNTTNWVDEPAIVYYKKLNSDRKIAPDTSIHTFHRRPFSQPWYRDLGNQGSPVMNLLFTPQHPAGPSLGIHVYDRYRYNIDSISFYNTTRPYSSFTYQLGSKLEQVAQILHTQNILPHWNFAFNYRKINSPGYYFTERNNHGNLFFSSHYESRSQRYQASLGIVYNKEQHDENGGIQSDSFLSLSSYSDRKSVPVNFATEGYSSTRSPVTNELRDFSIMLQHQYTWGRYDTAYSKDSSQYAIQLQPRFRIAHRAEFGSSKYTFRDVRPDSLRYTAFFNEAIATGDSVYTRQQWFYVDNSVSINGLIGKTGNQLLVSAGVGNRWDNFRTEYLVGQNSEQTFSNYLTGTIRKEAVADGQWDFSAKVKVFTTGDFAGNADLDGFVGKDMKQFGTLLIGAKQVLTNAPYNYRYYRNQYWMRGTVSFEKESTTQLYAMVNQDRWHASAGVRSYLLSNYLYFNQAQLPDQYATAFNVTQVWLRKLFFFGKFTLDNELVYQNAPSSAPVNIPELLGRHQLALETAAFNSNLKMATGIEVRYHSSYYASGYAPLFSQFYYQNSYYVSNTPEASVFFNFRIKRFRAYIMADQVQQLFNRNTIITNGYAAQNFMIRFGFNWVMIN